MSLALAPAAETVLDFWYSELKPADWFRKSDALDEQIRARFGAVHARACQGELWEWRTSARGRLAEVIVLDQFSRNLYRDDPRAWAADPMALVLAQEAVAGGHDQALETPMERCFLYMPYMHSESSLVHEQAVVLFDQPGLEDNLGYEYKHKAIVDRFGRYPHRNAILDRESTPEELAFLQQPGSSF